MLSSVQSGIVKVLRTAGQSLDAVGRNFEVNPVIERLQPSTRAVKFGAVKPVINGAFIAPSATVVGNVKIGSNSSVWYGAVIRGDVNTITIGDGVSVGDRVMIHCSGTLVNKPTVIGDNVVIEAGAIIHGSTLESGSFIGAGAQVLDGAKVSKNAMIAAGALLAQGKTVPSGQLWAGVPASYSRDLTPAEIAAIAIKNSEQLSLASVHAQECVKTFETIDQEEYDSEQQLARNPAYFKRLTPQEISHRIGEFENHQVPGRVLDSPVSARQEVDSRP